MEIKLGNVINIGYPNRNQDKDLTVLVGDVGGTKTLLSYYKVTNTHFELLHETRYKSRKHDSLLDILKHFERR